MLHCVVLHSSGILEITYSMNTYVLFHFEYKNDVTIIVKLPRATRMRLVVPYRSLTMIVGQFVRILILRLAIKLETIKVAVNRPP